MLTWGTLIYRNLHESLQLRPVTLYQLYVLRKPQNRMLYSPIDPIYIINGYKRD